MGATFPQISRFLPNNMEIHSSADIVSDAVDTISTIRDILSAISDDKSLAIFRVIAEEDNTGVESLIICRNLQLTHKKYYRRLTDLIRYSLIIRKDGSKKYILTCLGKVVIPLYYRFNTRSIILEIQGNR